jgi:addiction module RelB/DinJ family antitoxin
MITVEVIAMQKKSTISLRVDSNLKNDVESILNTLGIPMTTAIIMYFNQIKMRNGIPFTPVISNPRTYDDYSNDELIMMADSSISEYNKGKSLDSSDVESKIKSKF